MGSDNSTLGTVWQQVLSQLNQLHGERSSKSGEGEERLEDLRAALRESPRDPDRCLALVQCCKDMDRHDEALEVLRNAVRLSPRQVSLHHAYITILRQTGRTAELLESLDAAVKA